VDVTADAETGLREVEMFRPNLIVMGVLIR
jgi:hypothetical protein